MHTIRQMTGVCPQHDILFDLLTPREHLEFFAAVRVSLFFSIRNNFVTNKKLVSKARFLF
jgi:ABC-type multidrug transport system ATPase subunit